MIVSNPTYVIIAQTIVTKEFLSLLIINFIFQLPLEVHLSDNHNNIANSK